MNVILHLSDLFFICCFVEVCFLLILSRLLTLTCSAGRLCRRKQFEQKGKKLLDWCTDVNTTLKRISYRFNVEEL